MVVYIQDQSRGEVHCFTEVLRHLKLILSTGVIRIIIQPQTLCFLSPIINGIIIFSQCMLLLLLTKHDHKCTLVKVFKVQIVCIVQLCW